jgi:hypothetical protein
LRRPRMRRADRIDPCSMNIRSATRQFEAWLHRQTPVVEKDLRLKHQRMSESPFVFLRATFYRWIELWRDICSKHVDVPRVLAVGDLHVENFGTWRDAEGRLIWGINDVDEASVLPYSQDLVRLAASALLAIDAEHFSLAPRDACAAILEGYCASLARGGTPVVLSERRRWLRDIALNDLRDPVVFWTRLLSCADADGRVPRPLLRSAMPRGTSLNRFARRVAGVGSLGRPRFVALGSWGGALVAREVKAWVASAASPNRSSPKTPEKLLRSAVRVPDPYFAIRNGWIIRRLAPDCTRIEIGELPRRRDEAKLLRAMGWETANLHLGSASRRVKAHATGRGPRWLQRAAADMAQAVVDDWKAWTSEQSRDSRR